jgi:hypothetical protein
MLTLQTKERVTKERKNEMKNKILRTITGAAFTLSVAAALWLTNVSAQNGNPQGNAIVGLWDVVVDNRACDGPTISTFVSMHKFELGGTAQTVPATRIRPRMWAFGIISGKTIITLPLRHGGLTQLPTISGGLL